MDITNFVVNGREQALLYGDHITYQAATSRKLVACRKKLGIATKNRGKFHVKKDITAEEIASNPEYVYLGLLTSERAWAHALGIKSQHKSASNPLSHKARSHIVSRLRRASIFSRQVASGLFARDGSITTDVLEARAYSEMIIATEAFERRQWDKALASYTTSQAIYSALFVKTNNNTIKELITETLDPNMRYAAYQIKVPRTLPIDVIVRKYFPGSSNADLAAELNKIDPTILKGADIEMTDAAGPIDDTPKTISWRSRQVPIEDGAIASAWGRVQSQKAALPSLTVAAVTPRDRAACYDDILAATQEAVDATKQAIDELRAEGIPQGDARMQALQMTRTAVSYEMISYQIGRNRVLSGEHDGANNNYVDLTRRQLRKQTAAPTKASEIKPGQILTKFKERVALYDRTLASFRQILELPGVASDEVLAGQLAARNAYFTALKAYAIGRSHALAEKNVNALSLFNYALTSVTSTVDSLAAENAHPPMNGLTPLTVDVSLADAKYLKDLLAAQVLRFRAIVHIHNLRTAASTADASTAAAVTGIPEDKERLPLLETLGEYPTVVDPKNLVQFPPKPTLIPTKPIFLDVAWNYIDYPGKSGQAAVAGTPEVAEQKPAKKGWFGFGR